MVALHLGAWATVVCLQLHGGTPLPGHCRILSWTCLLVIAGCAQTICVRLRRIMVALEGKSK
jgi:hypothetical protein